jgi:hypothetical protein
MVHAISRLSRGGRAVATVGAALFALLVARPSRAADAVPIDEHTALMVGEHNLKLGVLAFEYGLTHNFSIGIDAPYYAVGAFTSNLFIPNLHLKAAIIQRPDFVLSALVGGYYIRIKDGGTRGNLLSVPVSLLGSVPVARRLWLHGELNYNWARSIGDGTVNDEQVKGTVATRSGQLGLMGEYRFTRVVAAIARARYQALTSPVVIEGTANPDPYTEVHLQAELRPSRNHPWMAVAGIALTWSHVGLLVAGGYGTPFIPGANVPLGYKGFVPDASFWVTF